MFVRWGYTDSFLGEHYGSREKSQKAYGEILVERGSSAVEGSLESQDAGRENLQDDEADGRGVKAASFEARNAAWPSPLSCVLPLPQRAYKPRPTRTGCAPRSRHEAAICPYECAWTGGLARRLVRKPALLFNLLGGEFGVRFRPFLQIIPTLMVPDRLRSSFVCRSMQAAGPAVSLPTGPRCQFTRCSSAENLRGASGSELANQNRPSRGRATPQVTNPTRPASL